MNKISDLLSNKKNIAIICLFTLVISLMPLFVVGIYTHPTGDDILYGLQAHQKWEETHSIFETVNQAVDGVKTSYYTWQGTYAAMFFMRLQPSVFSEDLYPLTPVMVIFSLIVGSFFLLKQFGRYILILKKEELFGIWSVLLLFSMQRICNIGEAYFWFNGAIYYTGFFGLLLLFWGLLIKYMYTHKKGVLIWMFLIAFIIGGGNYLTLLWNLIILFLLTVYLWLKSSRDKMAITVLFVFEVCCFILSASAPGNKVREAVSTSMSAKDAILESLKQGTRYLSVYTNPTWLLGAFVLSIFVVPALWRSKYSFRYPIIVLLFLYGFFCSLSTPTFYAQSNVGPGRAINLSSYGYVMLSYLALFYCVGYYIKHFEELFSYLYLDCYKKDIKSRYGIFIFCLLLIVFSVNYTNEKFMELPSVVAMRNIVSGGAKAYDAEYKERINYIKAHPNEDIVLLPYVHQPASIYVGDYGMDAEQESNLAFASWYGVKSVRINYYDD